MPIVVGKPVKHHAIQSAPESVPRFQKVMYFLPVGHAIYKKKPSATISNRIHGNAVVRIIVFTFVLPNMFDILYTAIVERNLLQMQKAVTGMDL